MRHHKQSFVSGLKLTDVLSAVCMLFMLCAVPLLFRNAFFDINRFKVEAVCKIVPAIMLAMAAAFFCGRKRETQRFAPMPAEIAMLALLSACVISCALVGFERAALDGSEGRYCGLIFMLCCGAAFFAIGCGRFYGILVVPVLLCASLVAVLGMINAVGLDPLGFYERIKKGQEQIYLSTIGHFDFFGTYLVMLFPIAGAQYVFSKKRSMRIIGVIAATLIALGAMASRTDSALAGLHMGCFMLFAVSGGSFSRIARALILWAISFAALPVMFNLLKLSPYHPSISGSPMLVFDLHLGEICCVLLLVLALICVICQRKGIKAPDRKWMCIVLFVLFMAAVLALLGVVAYFSCVDLETKLGEAGFIFRFNDNWGSLRGFAWIRSLRAFDDYDLLHKLFGSGMESTLRVLTPYFDNPSMLRTGVFNDPHCQPLQMLLTCGLTGMIAFVGFYLIMLVTLLRRAGDHPVLCGVLGSVFAYSIILMINVTQPILIATYFSICALGISCIRQQNRGEEKAA